MTGWRAFVVRLLRVPPDPEPPPGEHVRTFRAAQNYYWFKVAIWLTGTLALLAAVVIFGAVLMIAITTKAPFAVRLFFEFLMIAGALTVVLKATFGFAVLRLDYELRWYMISDRAIRIREGILFVREKTIALANVQNTTVKQGPLQRLLGIADVEVRTAGGGSGEAGGHQAGQIGEPMHIGYFRGVGNAGQLRQIILDGVRKHRDSGLGDPEEEHHADPAERLLGETRALRETLQRFYS